MKTVVSLTLPPEGQDSAHTNWGELFEARVDVADALPNCKVKIIGLTPEPIECTGERFVALLKLCTSGAWQKVLEAAEDEDIPRRLSEEFGGL